MIVDFKQPNPNDSKQPNPNIVFVAFDLCRKHEDAYALWEKKTASEKIKIIVSDMKAKCLKLKKDEENGSIAKNAMWIYGLREYAITEAGGNRFVTSKTRELLKEEMKKLTADFPQLTVIAGTVATTKEVSSPSKTFFSKVQAKYDAALAPEQRNPMSADYDVTIKPLYLFASE